MSIVSRDVIRWGVLWRSENKLDGYNERVQWDAGMPLLFFTKAEAKKYIDEKFGYIKARPDLKKEPHGWKMPTPVRVQVSVYIA